MDLNTEFRRLLENAGWSQARAAVELHTTTATISRYVTGKMKPRPQVIAHLAHITHQVAILPEGKDATALSEEPRRLEESERRLLEAIRRVPAPRRKRVVESLITAVEAHATTVEPSSDPLTAVRKLVLDTAASSAAEIRRNRGKGAAPK